MEPTTVIATGLAVLGSRELLTKLLGPTADYIGSETKNLVEKCNLNLDRIFLKATQKLGTRIDEEGTVNPRVLKHILDEGPFCEDELTSEYYSGILASARVSDGRDDRGATLLMEVKGLSVYQLRFHYAFYSLINRVFNNQDYNLGTGQDCGKLRMFVSNSAYEALMNFSDSEDAGNILAHTLLGLSRHNLIGSDFQAGDAETLQVPNINEGGITITPSLHGAELFLWSLGLKGASGREILNVEIPDQREELRLDGALQVEKLKQQAISDSFKSGREVEYSGDKTPVLHQTLTELEEELESRPQFRANEILARYLGKWMRLEGSIVDIVRRGDAWSAHIARPSSIAFISCDFESGETLLHAKLGDRIKLIGKMNSTLGVLMLNLKDCELLELNETIKIAKLPESSD